MGQQDPLPRRRQDFQEAAESENETKAEEEKTNEEGERDRDTPRGARRREGGNRVTRQQTPVEGGNRDRISTRSQVLGQRGRPKRRRTTKRKRT